MGVETGTVGIASKTPFDYNTIPVADDASEVDQIMIGDGTDAACILTGEWKTSQICIGVIQFVANIPFKVPGVIKPIAVRHQSVLPLIRDLVMVRAYGTEHYADLEYSYVEKVYIPPGVEKTFEFETKRGISNTSEFSVEVTANMGVSIEGLFDFGLEVKTGYSQSSTSYQETTEKWSEKLSGPADFWKYQQVVFYAACVTARQEYRPFLEQSGVRFVEKAGSFFFITAAFRNATPTTKPKQVPSLDDHKLIDYLLGSGFNKWSIQPISRLEGKLIKADEGDAIWLVLDEKLSHVLNPAVYDALFNSGVPLKFLPKVLVDRMPIGPTLGEGTQLIGGDGGVFLLHGGQKRNVASPDTMVKYNFNWSRVKQVGAGTAQYPTGPLIA